ncbi:MAG: response regulator [Roseiflexus sp.]|nr:response regulator [Roseiflexus sp.]MCS7288228.1 response regulator [Roseiflexus sp.]MDW8232828.1 response regulator [Roseiflexaceae bacterium]
MKDLCRGRILVIEKDHDLGRLFETILTLEGYHVTVTSHIDEAHRILPQLEPNLVVFDWSIHATAGFIWVDELRTSAHTAHIPVLLVCGMLPPRSIYEMLASAGVPIIEKPFDLLAFNRCVASLVHPRERAIGA